MANFRVSKARVAGLAVAVPEQTTSIEDFSGTADFEAIQKICASLGIAQRPTAPNGVCAAAAERVVERTGWERGSIDILVFVSQTPDYALPATACVLQQRLGLSTGC